MSDENTCSYVEWDSLNKKFVRCGRPAILFLAIGSDSFEVVSADEMNVARRFGAKYSIRRVKHTALCEEHRAFCGISRLSEKQATYAELTEALKKDVENNSLHTRSIELLV